MSLDYDLTQVDREKWPDGGIPLYDFCLMMMFTGINNLRKPGNDKKLEERAFMLDRVKNFGWYRADKKADEIDLIGLIPLMKGIQTNVTPYDERKWHTEFIRFSKLEYEDHKRRQRHLEELNKPSELPKVQELPLTMAAIESGETTDQPFEGGTLDEWGAWSAKQKA